ncbi:hypothetical protein [Saccharothrix longispora]|uniref:hypothetical protein n=1 Tax=Saccharothrix longispora TaxID=33920 RepID=UPI0028FD27BC|nr:hypothetical protein [Saccharothrix longispora]MDU0288298.1 hypothetical protein [Saccharothrix longispora]
MAFRSYRDQVTFAGDLLLQLATDGRLVLEPAEADRVIAGLMWTLEEVSGRLRVVDLLRGTSLPELRRVHPELERAVVDAVFDEQVTDGGLRRALDELPKYIEAIRKARKPASPGGP